jgi:pimeloyl-ACP methyl ester carboxylesterase
MKKSRLILLGLLSGVASTLALATYRRYLQDIDSALRTVLDGSKIINTVRGPIEYAEFGTGQPVLIVHGASGGYDQGLVMARLRRDIFRCIAMSRFGYLRTPLPEDHSPAAQAEAHAALLDKLEINKTVIIAGSAGGISALHFALRYPARCQALVLISAVTKQLKLRSPSRDITYGAIYRSEFVGWLVATLTSPNKTPLSIIPNTNYEHLSKEDMDWLTDFTQTTQPTSMRRIGMFTDIDQIVNLEPIPLDQISSPTLIIHAVDDGIVPIDHACHAHQNIPGAELLEIPGGGHLLMGHHELVKERVINFLQEHAKISPIIDQ